MRFELSRRRYETIVSSRTNDPRYTVLITDERNLPAVCANVVNNLFIATSCVLASRAVINNACIPIRLRFFVAPKYTTNYTSVNHCLRLQLVLCACTINKHYTERQ